MKYAVNVISSFDTCIQCSITQCPYIDGMLSHLKIKISYTHIYNSQTLWSCIYFEVEFLAELLL
jgi:hypothetical protein